VKVLYFDAFSGAAGDMILGALVDAGLPFEELKRALGTLGIEGWDVSVERVVKAGIAATKFRVHEHALAGGDSTPGHASGHRHHSIGAIKRRIDQSALTDAAKARAKALFDRLAAVEASVHDMPIERVHLHEVGALDSIVDIVGCVFALDWFGADRVVVSPINVGGGMVKTSHGVYPVPAPATIRLLGDAQVYGTDQTGELLTPTGALILTGYAHAYGPMPRMRVDAIGYGAGDRDLTRRPNVLRVVVGRSSESAEATTVAVMECEIDDMNPQIFGPLMDQLYDAGALEVFYASVQMKKNRPGTLMTVICAPEHRETLAGLVFRETTTIGVRFTEMTRDCLDREIVPLATPLGSVRVKVARRNGQVLNAQPEFEDVARLAAEHRRPIKEVQAIVWKAWLER
jgi:pyridinium-3,5-bisthiocarboxylic acid mononucleotide nickel chelatase